MRKPVVPHFLLLLLLFAVIFVALVYFQFSKKTNFTIREGDLVIQGNTGSNPGKNPNVYPLTGKVSIFFGGMEFILGDGLELLGFSNSSAGTAVQILPQLMTVADNEVYFRLTEGPELVFTTQYSGGSIELVIRANFSTADFSLVNYTASDSSNPGNAAEETAEEAVQENQNFTNQSLKIPFKALNTSIVQDTGRQFLVNADGINYTFSRNTGNANNGSRSNAGGGFILLEAQNPAISYRVVPDKESVNPRNFIIPAALNDEEYEAALALWLDQSYMLWNRTVATGGELNGDLVNAYMSEALKRGTYRAAFSAVSSAWNPASVFYEGSAFVGRLDTALRTLSATERERSGRLARLFNEKSLEFLKEFDIIEFLAIRGYSNLMDDAAAILRTLDPAVMTAEQAAGILEGYLAWNRYRQGRFNPFDRFIDQAMFVVTGSLIKSPTGDSALVFTKTGNSEIEADAELNLRLGRSLLKYEEEIRKSLGKTLILSVLSQADRTGSVPRKILSNFSGDRERVGSHRVYRICFAGENYARAQAAGSGIWAWTAASSINGIPGSGRLEITVDFPAGETHFMIIRGIRPFSTLQFNGINYNQDNQFERYDYSGWVYSPAEQSLLVKIRHRLPTERIIIFY